MSALVQFYWSLAPTIIRRVFEVLALGLSPPHGLEQKPLRRSASSIQTSDGLAVATSSCSSEIG
jgi:hypothetical protein